MPKKVLFIGDIHLGSGAFPADDDGLTFRDRDLLGLLDGVTDGSLDYVVFLGDIYDTPRPSNELRSAFTERAVALVRSGVGVVVVVGNHDMTARCHALEPLKRADVGVVVVDKAETVLLDDVRLYCLPWSIKAARNWPEAMESLIAAVPNGRWSKCGSDEVGLIVGHLPVKGAKVGPSNHRLDSTAATVDHLERLRRKLNASGVLLAHYHKAQALSADGKIQYVGSLGRIDFGERGETKRCVLLDGEKLRDAPVADRPMIQIEDPDDIGDVKEAVVKVRLKGVPRSFADSFNFDALRMELYSQGAKHVMPLEMTVAEAHLAGRADEGKYGGGVERAIEEFVAEKWGEELDVDEIAATTAETLSMMRDE